MAWNNQRGGYRSGGIGNRGGEKQTYPNSGSLWPNDKKTSDKHPDVRGTISVNDEVLDYIHEVAANGGEVKLEISGWEKQAQSGAMFLSLKVQIPYADRREDQNPPPRQRSQFARRQPDQEERAQYGPPQQNIRGYGQQSRGDYEQQGGRMRTAPPRQQPQGQSQEEFARGDRMPSFMQDDNPDDIPFR